MLRRNSSRNKQRRPLSRSKSTSAIPRNPVHTLEFIDPATAERDAHLAALLSYHRAHGRLPTEMTARPRDPASFIFDGNDSVASSYRRGLRRSDSATSRHEAWTNASTIKRQQSIRFAGPSARPRRTLAARASENRPSSATPTMRPGVLRNLDNRTGVTLPSVETTPITNSLTRRYLRSLQVPDEYYTTEADAPSSPSSYKKLRRSRSMFTSSDSKPSESGYYFNNGTPVRQNTRLVDSRYAPLNKENEPLGELTTAAPELRAPKSMSFLRNRHDRTTLRSSSRAENDLAVHLAREKFREQVEQQASLKSHPSMFFRSKNKRSESSAGFRKSLRNSSNNSTALSSTFVSNTLNIPKQGSLRKTARKVSKTLRTKLKGLFARPKSTEIPDCPAEVLNFQLDSDGESCLHMESIPPPDEASVSRVLSHLPSLHAVPSHQQMRSRKGSVESACSDEEQQYADDKSRVTSWTNSITNTISSQGTIGELERQQLSVIKENSTHISPSSSRSKHHSSDVFQGQPSRPIVDSQRVYSALMKRMEELNTSSVKQSASGDEAYRISPTRISSIDYNGSGRWTPSTIRHVKEDDVFQNQKCLLIPETSSSESLVKHPRCADPATRRTSHEACHIPANSDERNVSPTRQHAKSSSEHEPPVTLSQRSSAFFASPTCHLFRTTSPFRRALQENMRTNKDNEQVDLSESKYLSSLSALSLPMRRPSSAGSDRDPRSAYAKSVYSCTTEDTKIGRAKEVEPTANLPEPPASKYQRGHGDVTIFVDRPTYKPCSSHKRDVSTASSVEWKTWLSANVSKLETPVTSPQVKAWEGGSFGLSHSGHVRELAEIESPGEVLGLASCKPDGPPDRCPLGPVEGTPFSDSSGNIIRKLSNKLTQTRNENNAPGATLCPGFGHDSPQVLRKRRLRTVPSLPIVRTESGTNNTHEFSRIPRMRSLNTIGYLASPREDAFPKRRSRNLIMGQGSSANSSPGLTGATERQFGQATSGSPAQRIGRNMGQLSPNLRMGRVNTEEKLVGTSLAGPGLDAQAMGSKRMVDIFLNNRRKKTQMSNTSSGSSPAFL